MRDHPQSPLDSTNRCIREIKTRSEVRRSTRPENPRSGFCFWHAFNLYLKHYPRAGFFIGLRATNVPGRRNVLRRFTRLATYAVYRYVRSPEYTDRAWMRLCYTCRKIDGDRRMTPHKRPSQRYLWLRPFPGSNPGQRAYRPGVSTPGLLYYNRVQSRGGKARPIRASCATTQSSYSIEMSRPV